jgi:hypothetical protein
VALVALEVRLVQFLLMFLKILKVQLLRLVPEVLEVRLVQFLLMFLKILKALVILKFLMNRFLLRLLCLL